MEKRQIVYFFVIAIVGICSLALANAAVNKEKRQMLRIGVYDSRLVAVAYTHSTLNDNMIQKIADKVHKAEAKGDTEAAKKLREKMEWKQRKGHLQGFGTMPVHEYLEPVKEKLPAIAADAKVDVIMSKWEFDYISPDADVVDVTDEIIKLYDALNEKGKERVAKIVEQIKNVKPIDEEKILEDECH